MHQPSLLGAATRPSTKTQPAACQSRTDTPSISKKLFVRGELPAEFFALLAKAFDRYQPDYLNDAQLVSDTVRAAWMFLRHSRARTEYETKLFRRKPDPAHRTSAESERLETLRQCHRRVRRSLFRRLKKIRYLRRSAEPRDIEQVQHLHHIFASMFDLEAFPYDLGS